MDSHVGGLQIVLAFNRNNLRLSSLLPEESTGIVQVTEKVPTASAQLTLSSSKLIGHLFTLWGERSRQATGAMNYGH